MSDNTRGVTVAQIPRGQSLSLVSAVGSLLDAALNGAMLASGNGSDVAGTVTARRGMTEREVTALLNAAARRIGKGPHQVAAEDDPGEPELPLGLGHMAVGENDVHMSLTGAAVVAAEVAKQFITMFIPAMDELGAENYLSWDATDPATGKRYTLICLRPGGKTPHEKRLEAEAEVARLRSLLEESGIPVGGAA